KAKFDGGGLYFDDATPVITNATIANNRADDDGGGIYLTAATSGSDTMYLRNSILWGNTAGNRRNQMFRSNARSVFNYVLYRDSTNDVTTSSMATGSSNNLTIDPRFINEVGMDFRLQGVSPGVDSGNDSYNSLATDIRRNNFGRKRAKTDATQTGTIDRGAFEYNETTEDSDRDGIPDIVENEGCTGPAFCDTDGDGVEDIIDNDSDGDGIPDDVEDTACTGALPCTPTDTDNDGIPDFQDLDSDGDGIADDDENSDCTGTLPCTPTDTDEDGTPDYLDADSDGDGIPDVVEDSFCEEMMMLGTLSLVEATTTTSTCDSDGDGTPDFRDLDSDGDGIPDSVEDSACTGTLQCTPTDTDEDGLPDYLDTDSDGDGIPDDVEDEACTGALPCTPTDSDNDGTPNYLDLDSDGDGIPDEIEDTVCTGALPCTPTDSDNDGTPNYLDIDSDNDGIHDDVEDGECSGTAPCTPTDSDDDGTPDYLDVDSDGDNIPDAIENDACDMFPDMPVITVIINAGVSTTCDADEDGIPNYLDVDSDGDGLSDNDEDLGCSGTAPCTPTDTDGDGLPDYLNGCTNPDNPGSIAAEQYICEGMVPAKIASLSLPSGETGDLEYKWQSSPSGGGTGFVDIPNSNSPEYQPGALAHDRWYRRLARVDCEEDWSEAAISNESAVIVKKPSNQYLVVQTLQQPKCDPPTGCKVTISGLPVATWRMEQNGPVDGYINGSGNPYTIENLPDGVYQFKVATPAGCLQTPPFGVIIITY
ncbi:MAG: hypothetical protein LW630_10145, partial [Saprospiraceae bacterium]|nr:hypothetical protein [Saprospiraceae bacterium]